LKKLISIRFKTEFNIYATFHISVIEDEFSLINNTGVWPAGCLLALLYGNLTPDQMYSSSTFVTADTVLPVGFDRANKYVKRKGDDGANGGNS
jgi:hypothetical protein